MAARKFCLARAYRLPSGLAKFNEHWSYSPRLDFCSRFLLRLEQRLRTVDKHCIAPGEGTWDERPGPLVERRLFVTGKSSSQTRLPSVCGSAVKSGFSGQ